jgi:HK97 family phage portal protein
MSQALLTEARESADTLQRVLKSVALQPEIVLGSDDYQRLGPMMQKMVDVQLYRKAQNLQSINSRGGWWSIVKEPWIGAWQRNQDIRLDNVITYSAVFACVTLIASDVAKLCLRLVQEDSDGIWTEIDSPAFSPVLRRPNRYQTIIKFLEQWVVSKLVHGNAFVLKQRDDRKVVTALYVLDPTRVIPLVAQDGAVYYELRRDDLSGLPQESVIVPAKEMIHDTMVAIFHPLMGVSPIYACGLAAMQGLAIQNNSNTFFSAGSQPGGVLTSPLAISDETAARAKAYWDANYSGSANVGKVAVLGDGLKYEAMSVNAVDSQLIEQLKWTAETVCTCFHVPPYMIGVGPPPPYANVEPLLQQYYSQCIQSQLTSIEAALDYGIGLGAEFGNAYGTEFDIGDLIWMDTTTRTKAGTDAISGGLLSPNEARKRYQGVGKVKGGESPYLQQQNYSLAALAKRDADDPFAKPTLTSPPTTEPPPDMTTASFGEALHRKMIEAELYAA